MPGSQAVVEGEEDVDCEKVEEKGEEWGEEEGLVGRLVGDLG